MYATDEAAADPVANRKFLEILLTAYITSQRESVGHGTDWCRRRFMGPWRRTLGTSFPPTVTRLMPEAPPGAVLALEARDEAAAFLAAQCRACGQCKLARM